MIVERLRQQGNEVTIISLPWRNYGRHLLDNFSRSFFRRLCELEVDVLIQDELNHPSLIWLNRRLKQVVDYPLVSLIHLLRCNYSYPRWQKPLYCSLEQRYLKSVDGFIYNSHESRQSVEKMVGGRPSGVVVYPGKDHLRSDMTLEEMEKRANRDGPLELLFVGNLTPHKGLHILLTALTQLPLSEWRLTVIGRLDMAPSYVVSIERQISQAGLAAHVTLLGARSHAQIAQHLTQSQLFVMPSLYEAFGMVYLEALGFGLPVIATTAGAAHEMITDQKNGLLVPPNDPTALALAIRTLNRERQRLAEMSLAAYARYELHPTWEESAMRIGQFVEKVRQHKNKS